MPDSRFPIHSMPMNKLSFFFAGLVMTCRVLVSQESLPEDARVRLTENSILVLAAVEEGEKSLGQPDAYIEALGPLEKRIRMRTEAEVSTEQFLEHVQKQVIPWTEEQQQRLRTTAGLVAKELEALELELPQEILLIQTTGEDESGAAYTRGNAIVFSQQRMQNRDSALRRLLAHELFHVLSRHDPQLRQKLYALIGFKPCNPITLPESLAPLRLTNPDAPTLDYYITVKHEEEMLQAVPVLVSDVEKYDPGRKRLFDYLQFRLLAVHRAAGSWKPLLSDGEPILIDGRKNESYREQIGDNTRYIIHPDEVLADNFAHIVMRTKELKTPDLVEKMKVILMGEDARDESD